MPVTTPDPGIHLGVPDSIYRSWNLVCQSDLSYLCNGRTLAHARQAILMPEDPTPAKLLGQAIHFAILQPAEFEKNYAPWAGDKRTKKGREAWKIEMRDAVWRNPIFASILGGERYIEVSAVWQDPETGLLCKGRIDCLTTHGRWTVVADLKSTKDASPQRFARDVFQYGWHRQGAFYLDGLDILDPRDRLWLLLAIEKQPPYCGAVYELGYDDLEQGRQEYRKALAAWAEAEESAVWPGYPADIQSLSLPPWARRLEEE
jgi:hypothetical protein